MTPLLHVQLRLHGAVIDDRLVGVRDQAWFGECDGALIPFEGGIVGVRATGEGLRIRHRPLEPGQPVTRRFGPVELRLEATLPARLPRDWSGLPDPILAVASVALILAGAFVDTLGARWEADEGLRAAIERGVGLVEAPPADPSPPEARPSRDRWPPPATFATGSE